MKKMILVLLLSSTSTYAGVTGLNIPFCESTASQFQNQPEKMSHFKSALSATVDYYQYLSLALGKLIEAQNSTLCARVLVVGQNSQFVGLSKLQYYFQFEVTENGMLTAKVPVIMVNTSEQGHMNPGSKQWMTLDNKKIKSLFGDIIENSNFASDSELLGAPSVTGPDFIDYLKALPLGQNFMKTENAMVLPLDVSNGSQYFILSVYVERTGIVGDKVLAHTAIILKQDQLSGRLYFSNSVNMYYDVFMPISESRTAAPLTLEEQVKQIVENGKQF